MSGSLPQLPPIKKGLSPVDEEHNRLFNLPGAKYFHYGKNAPPRYQGLPSASASDLSYSPLPRSLTPFTPLSEEFSSTPTLTKEEIIKRRDDEVEEKHQSLFGRRGKHYTPPTKMRLTPVAMGMIELKKLSLGQSPDTKTPSPAIPTALSEEDLSPSPRTIERIQNSAREYLTALLEKALETKVDITLDDLGDLKQEIKEQLDRLNQYKESYKKSIAYLTTLLDYAKASPQTPEDRSYMRQLGASIKELKSKLVGIEPEIIELKSQIQTINGILDHKDEILFEDKKTTIPDKSSSSEPMASVKLAPIALPVPTSSPAPTTIPALKKRSPLRRFEASEGPDTPRSPAEEPSPIKVTMQLPMITTPTQSHTATVFLDTTPVETIQKDKKQELRLEEYRSDSPPPAAP